MDGAGFQQEEIADAYKRRKEQVDSRVSHLLTHDFGTFGDVGQFSVITEHSSIIETLKTDHNGR